MGRWPNAQSLRFADRYHQGMAALNSARAWLFVVPLLACRPGGDDGEDEVAEFGTGTSEADSDSESGSSGSESSSTAGESTDATTQTGTATDADTTDTTGTTGDGDGSCSTAADCTLVNDCCNCVAVPLGQEPGCDLPECFALTCEASLGYSPDAECSMGTCQLTPTSCDLDQIACLMPEPPPCEGGLVRSVMNSCYGACVPPSSCETLPFECDATTCGDGFACLTTQSGAPSQCVPLPAACGGVASCECVAPWFSEVCVASCGEAGGTLLCQDGG